MYSLRWPRPLGFFMLGVLMSKHHLLDDTIPFAAADEGSTDDETSTSTHVVVQTSTQVVTLDALRSPVASSLSSMISSAISANMMSQLPELAMTLDQPTTLATRSSAALAGRDASQQDASPVSTSTAHSSTDSPAPDPPGHVALSDTLSDGTQPSSLAPFAAPIVVSSLAASDISFSVNNMATLQSNSPSNHPSSSSSVYSQSLPSFSSAASSVATATSTASAPSTSTSTVSTHASVPLDRPPCTDIAGRTGVIETLVITGVPQELCIATWVGKPASTNT